MLFRRLRRKPLTAAERQERLLRLTAKHSGGGIVVESAEARTAYIVSAGSRELAIRSLRRVTANPDS